MNPETTSGTVVPERSAHIPLVAPVTNNAVVELPTAFTYKLDEGVLVPMLIPTFPVLATFSCASETPVIAQNNNTK
jgi:hypothetical protein